MDRNVSPDELKRAYKKAAIKNHPDKGGDPEKARARSACRRARERRAGRLTRAGRGLALCRQFKEISAAYEVLADPEKRQIYDEYGEDALKEGMGGGGGGFGGNPFDIFENLFGGNPFGGARAPQARVLDVARRHTLTPRRVTRRHAGRRPWRPRRPTQGRGCHAPAEGEPGRAVQRNHEEAVAGEERHLLQMRRVRRRAAADPSCAAAEHAPAAVAGRAASPATRGAARAARGLGLKSTCARLRPAWCSRCRRRARSAEAKARPPAPPLCLKQPGAARASLVSG